ncbi:SCP2 sterol-binding domain-containing protein [Anaerocolumna sp. AGMB13025]|uniref:SCP2 sterol-binding domain-containing protein n=1 Tax=Anaerocolumna sp. AGMB13025 TaxID=3039116 RepID=UPI00241FEE8C|nr:SCP2 sterol-binding domain-containing protein [Anaerocolumna sp. AGMB13025]WFR57562.1 SCP2 sterol-binding domain-containing protein [Anaerocolumna sp. AGMB13025]
MNVNIYYGGRGLIEDPTIYVINKLTEVLNEIRVNVVKYNLYEEKNAIAVLPKTLKEADGIILATNVEWLGIGGYMQQFLDACWLYGDKEHISKLYMMPIVMANSYGEREAELYLIKAWEMLGGITCNGLRAYVEDHVDFETNSTYGQIIEKQAELFYKVINQKTKMLPASNSVIRNNMLKGFSNDLTPQENEQLSMYVSDDTYVKKQKEDIEELAQIFKGMLGSQEKELKQEFIHNIRENFHPLNDFKASYTIEINDTMKTLVIDVNGSNLNCYYGEKEDADVAARTTYDVLNKIINGRMTVQRAFMSGELTAKGNFKTLRTFDQIFQFNII